jgi:hypothetical protein
MGVIRLVHDLSPAFSAEVKSRWSSSSVLRNAYMVCTRTPLLNKRQINENIKYNNRHLGYSRTSW